MERTKISTRRQSATPRPHRLLLVALLALAAGPFTVACGGDGQEAVEAAPAAEQPPPSEAAPAEPVPSEPAAPTTAEVARYSGETGLGWKISFDVSARGDRLENITLFRGEPGSSALSCRSGNGLSFLAIELPLPGSSKIAKDGSFARGFSLRIPTGSIALHGSNLSVLTQDVGRIGGVLKGSLSRRKAAGTLSVQVSFPSEGSTDRCASDTVKWSARRR